MDIEEDGMEIDCIEVYSNEEDGIGLDGIVGDGIGDVLSSVVTNLVDELDINCSIL